MKKLILAILCIQLISLSTAVVAKSHEGKLQVELAHLLYQKTRLVRTWTHLERQRGGYGFLGGPGETQLEIDKRLLSQRIKKIKYLLI